MGYEEKPRKLYERALSAPSSTSPARLTQAILSPRTFPAPSFTLVSFSSVNTLTNTMKGIAALVTAALLGQAVAAPPEPPTNVVEKRAAPTVTISQGSVVGVDRLKTEAFNGIPFAKPPVGPLRLKPPSRLTSSFGVFDATGIAPACPQFLADSDSNDFLAKVLDTVTGLPFFQKALKISEDCLTVNVIRPKGVKAGDKLPVLFWIFGGGFQVGSTVADARPSGTDWVATARLELHV